VRREQGSVRQPDATCRVCVLYNDRRQGAHWRSASRISIVVQTGVAYLPKPGDLNRGRLRGEGEQPVAVGMTSPTRGFEPSALTSHGEGIASSRRLRLDAPSRAAEL